MKKTIYQIVEQFNRINNLYNENTKKFGVDEIRINHYLKGWYIVKNTLYENGVATSCVLDKKNRNVYFNIKRKGLHPFVFVGEKKVYLKPNTMVRYFKDYYYTPICNWCSIAHIRNEKDELVVDPKILAMIKK